MQTLNWYYRRLKAMSPAEMAWRMQSHLRDNADKLLVKRRQQSRTLYQLCNGQGISAKPGFRVSETGIMSQDDKNGKTKQSESLLARAEKILENRLSFFDLKDTFLGNPIIWNRDHKIDKDTPMIFSSSIDYRDAREAGDCKYVWEPNRHHQLVVLARAYRISGDTRFAKAVAEQLDSWLQQNPYGIGMNWRSNLELGIRLINWVWAIDLIRESKVITDKLYLRIMDSVSRHIWEIDRKYARGSSANNHLIGEAAGVFAATSYFRNLKYASKLRQKAKEILMKEILNQTFPDGGTREQATGYHIFIFQFFVIAGLIARETDQYFLESYWSRLEKMLEFIKKLGEGGDSLPMFGDCDDGYVLDISDNPHSVKEWLAIAGTLLGNHDSEHRTCCSSAFSETGYYLLQHGEHDSPERISVVFDCGPLGMGTLAGHGHADALSFTLRVFGKDILVDPGTYDYFSYPQWRECFRGTSAHNTLVVDGMDQSEMLGLFLWGKKAEARCLCWEPSDRGGRVTAEHNGYACLKDPVTHRRTLELDGEKRVLTIRDEIIAQSEHDITMYFHLAENCIVTSAGQNHYTIGIGNERIDMVLDASLDVELHKGSTNPICGWVSRGYHQKQASTTIAGRCTCKGKKAFLCSIKMGEPTVLGKIDDR